MYEAHIHAGLPYPVVGAPQGALHEIDTGDLPAPLGELYAQIPRPVPRPSADPKGGRRPVSSRAKSSAAFATNGGSAAASSHGWKPIE